MHLTSAELRQLRKRLSAPVVNIRQYRQSHKHLVGVESRIMPTKIIHLGILYRFDHRLRNQFGVVVDTGKMLHHIEQQGGTATEQKTGMCGDDSTVLEFDGRRRVPGALEALLGGNGSAAEVGIDLCLVEEHLYLTDLVLIASSPCHLIGGIVVAADNLVLGCIAAHLIIRDAESHHIHSHISGRLIWIVAIDTLEESVEHGEDLDVAVVVDGNLVVCLKMEGVDHVNIVEVGSGCLVGDVHGMLKR